MSEDSFPVSHKHKKQFSVLFTEDPFTVSYKHKKQFSVLFTMFDCCASNLGSIPDQVCQF